ncbi:uncharacterized protein PgNI_03088 [Pyricularia grisea]|uniref:Uncharacterized protein n=1 Tax=Pyricularia grisea TaxID=148305 RepID=A0A6P8BBS6_PYRGI|nr:uncharacterized protein PgNI_03088 [Pyricularia grisea]TLD13142.1 hypothetical protein PgNI_03088 [Pyricularia grisea]
MTSKSCPAAVGLSHGSTAATIDAAYAYGQNLDLTFPLIHNVLDCAPTEDELGKPLEADLQPGLATTSYVVRVEETCRARRTDCEGVQEGKRCPAGE